MPYLEIKPLSCGDSAQNRNAKSLTRRNQSPALSVSSSSQVNIEAGVSVRLGKILRTLVVLLNVLSCMRNGTPS